MPASRIWPSVAKRLLCKLRDEQYCLTYGISAISSILLPHSRAGAHLCKPQVSAASSTHSPVVGIQFLWLLRRTTDWKNRWAVNSVDPSANESLWRTHLFPLHWEALAKLWKVTSGKPQSTAFWPQIHCIHLVHCSSDSGPASSVEGFSQECGIFMPLSRFATSLQLV